ncbi:MULTISPECIES: hypothetical protein [Prochlorococcus]|uniref:hypothetical protein n=1 Tax=Prochlorococcus TaxID=1218 RepID=UPI0007B33B96|nr:hypothetical protein [Prochlorococcus marinus]
MQRIAPALCSTLMMVAGLMAITGCRKNQPSWTTSQAEAINRLELRLDQLEHRLGQTTPSATDTNSKTPAGPVKSLTFRMESTDGRLRVYWADGSDSDLLCTKEQSTRIQWACG